MSKFARYTLESGKIVDSAINQFFAPTDDTHITMTNSSGGPNLIYVTGNSPLVLKMVDDTSVILFRGNGYTVAFAIDPEPGPTETYVCTNGTITGGVVRLK